MQLWGPGWATVPPGCHGKPPRWRFGKRMGSTTAAGLERDQSENGTATEADDAKPGQLALPIRQTLSHESYYRMHRSFPMV